MQIENDQLILDNEINDEMLDDLIQYLNDDNIKQIVIDTDNISSLALQQLFCIEKDKKVKINDMFIAKFFENITHIG
jgi:hypothetical protein